MAERSDQRRIYDAREQRLIAQGCEGEAKARWQQRWLAAGKPRSMLRNPR